MAYMDQHALVGAAVMVAHCQVSDVVDVAALLCLSLGCANMLLVEVHALLLMSTLHHYSCEWQWGVTSSMVLCA